MQTTLKIYEGENVSDPGGGGMNDARSACGQTTEAFCVQYLTISFLSLKMISPFIIFC